MLSTLARPSRNASATWTPLDPRWYTAIGGVRSDAGINVLPEDALKIAVVYRAVNVLAHSAASIPLVVYRRLPDDGKEKARTHPTYDLLHDKPNAWMTSFRWRHLAIVQKIIWGNHYSELIPGRGGIGQLAPLSPETTRVVDQLGDGRLVYLTREVTVKGYGPERTLLQDDVLHLRGFSIDGKVGLPLPRLARNAMGLALAAEKHGSMFLRKGARFSGLLSSDGSMNDDERTINERAWQRAYNGPEGSGATPLLTGGLKYQAISSDNKSSQWIESRTFQVEELLRFIGVPGVLCGYADKTSTYASAEQFFLAYVTHTVRPLTEEFAQELNASVVTGGPEYYADFVLEGLLKGDIKTRYEAHSSAIQAGWKSRNEVRVAEDLNRGPDDLDEFLEPVNMVEAGSRPDTAKSSTSAPARAPVEPGEDDEDDATNARLTRFAAVARRMAERLARRESVAIMGATGKLGAAKRFSSDGSGWRDWLTQFYTEHADAVAEDLGLSPELAQQYCTERRGQLEQSVPAPEPFHAAAVDRLVALLEAA